MSPLPRKLLVLDLDETLIHACETQLAHPEDFRVGPYFVYRRPHLTEFIASVSESFDLGVWTASGEVYAAQVIEQVFARGLLKFVWSSRRCTTARDWTTCQYTTIKNLSKLKRRGYQLESIVAADDTPMATSSPSASSLEMLATTSFAFWQRICKPLCRWTTFVPSKKGAGETSSLRSRLPL